MMSGRYVSALSPAERVHLEYLEAQAARRRRSGSPAPPEAPAGSREDALRRRWVALAGDDLRHEQEILSEWAGHHESGVRLGRDAAAVALAGLAGLACGVVLQVFS